MASKQLITLGKDGGLSFRMPDGSLQTLADWDAQHGEFYVYLVIDCSGSMSGNKIEKARRGGKDFAKSALADGYSVGVISFSDSTSHLLAPLASMTEIATGIDYLCIQGGTNMAPAIEEVMTRFKDKQKSTLAMVIVTDGLTINPELALQAAEKAKKMGISILTIGTDDADSTFLSRLASHSELSKHVSSGLLEEAISDTAKMLPHWK